MLGLAGRRATQNVVTFDTLQAALPPAFLCPVLHSNSRSRRSTRASTSSAPLRPTWPRTDAAEQHRSQTDTIHSQHFPSASSLSLSRRTDSWQHGGGSGNSNSHDLSDDQIKQELRLRKSVVSDIAKVSPTLSLSSDDLSTLKQSEERYFDLCRKPDLDYFDALLPELALAYMHIGRSQEAVRLVERLRAMRHHQGKSMSLEPWKSVFATAFTQQSYELLVQLAQKATDGLNPDDDWAMYARMEAQLCLLDKAKTTQQIDEHAIDQYWQEFSRVDRHAPREIFSSLLKSQIKRGRLDLAERTMLARQAHGHPDDAKLWYALVHLHPRGRRRACLHALVDRLGLNGSQVFAKVVRSCAKSKQLRRTLVAFRMFGIDRHMVKRGSGWRPGQVALSRLIELLISAKAPDAALSCLRLCLQLDVGNSHFYSKNFANILEHMLELGRVQESLALCTRVLDITLDGDQGEGIVIDGAYAKDALFCHGLSTHVVQAARSYQTLMRVCTHLEDPLTAVRLTRSALLAMMRHGIAVGPVTRGAVANVFMRVFQHATWRPTAFALDRLKVLLEDIPTAFEQPLKEFIDTLYSQGFVDSFVVKTRFHHPEPSRDARENLEWMTNPYDVSNSFVRQTQHRQSQLDQHEERQSQNSPWWTPFSERNRNTERESSLVESEEEFPDDPSKHLMPRMTASGYALRLRAFAVVRRDHPAAVVIYRHMVAHGVQPTSHHVAPIIEGLVLNGRLRDAQAIRDGARKYVADVDSSMRIAVAIVRGFARMGNWNAAHAELVGMQERGMKLNAAMWAAVQGVQYHQLRGRLKNKELLESSGRAVTQTLQQAKNNLISEIQLKQKIDLAKFTDDGKEGGSKEKSVQLVRLSLPLVIVKYVALFNGGRYERACTFLSQALDQGLVPDSRLNVRLRHDYQYLRKRARREVGLDVEGLMLAPQTTPYAASKQIAELLDEQEEALSDEDTLEKFPAIDKFVNEQESKEMMRVRHRQQRTSKALYWLPVLRTCLDNRNRTSSSHPVRREFLQREHQARQEVMQLTLDCFASSRLAEEAQALMTKTNIGQSGGQKEKDQE